MQCLQIDIYCYTKSAICIDISKAFPETQIKQKRIDRK